MRTTAAWDMIETYCRGGAAETHAHTRRRVDADQAVEQVSYLCLEGVAAVVTVPAFAAGGGDDGLEGARRSRSARSE